MKMLFVALLVSAASLTAAFSEFGVDEIEQLKDRILGKISYFQLFFIR